MGYIVKLPIDRYGQRIKPFVERELAAAKVAQLHGSKAEAFRYLERAHVLGQYSTWHHVRVHWRMLVWGVENKDLHECLGQVIRIAGAATKTFIRLVPSGNTGGANVSAFKRMPIPADLKQTIEHARSRV